MIEILAERLKSLEACDGYIKTDSVAAIVAALQAEIAALQTELQLARHDLAEATGGHDE